MFKFLLALAVLLLLPLLLLQTISPKSRAATPPVSPAQEISLLTPTGIRNDFLALITPPNNTIPLDPQLAPAAADTGNPGDTLVHFSLASPADRITGMLLLPPYTTKNKFAVVILLHGTGGKKEDELPLMRQLTAKNFLTVAIDAPYHGERNPRGTGPRPADGLKNAYERAVYNAWKNNVLGPQPAAKPAPHNAYPFFYDTVPDVMRLVDYLQTRPDVDPTRIGLYGVSKGGIETYLTAAADPRIAAAVPCIAVESFKWANENNMWQHRIETIQSAFDKAWAEVKSATPAAPDKPDPAFLQYFYNRINPGITSEFDGPSMIQLIAPRPLLTINGERDPRTPPASLKLCLDAAKSAYHAQNADDNLHSLIEPNTAHQVTRAAQQTAIDFFVKYLKP